MARSPTGATGTPSADPESASAPAGGVPWTRPRASPRCPQGCVDHRGQPVPSSDTPKASARASTARAHIDALGDKDVEFREREPALSGFGPSTAIRLTGPSHFVDKCDPQRAGRTTAPRKQRASGLAAADARCGQTTSRRRAGALSGFRFRAWEEHSEVRLSSDRRPRGRSVKPLPPPPQRAQERGDGMRSPGLSWGVLGAFGLSRAVSAGSGISAVYGKLIPRNPHHGHMGSTRNDGVGGSSPPVGFAESPATEGF